MNLIQIQEHLKDMPMRAIMEYANGKSTQVPPYLALGELNRRKQMSQQATQPPQGTVKDKIEQEVTGGQPNPMQAAAQGMPQPMQQAAPQPEAPQQAEPMPQMAGGGLTALPVGDMFKFASGGGVVAFAEGDLVIDQAEQEARDAKAALRRYGLMQRRQDPEGYAAAQQADAAAQAAYQNAKAQYEQEMSQSSAGRAAFNPTDLGAARDKLNLGASGPAKQSASVQPVVSPNDQSAAETARLARQNAGPPAGIASVATPPAAPPPAPAGGGIPAAIGLPAAPKFTAPNADEYTNKLAEFKRANPGLAGSEFQKLLDKIAQQDEADRARFVTQEKARTRADFWKSLIDAGESTRGQKGIGALLGGFGRSAGASEAAAAERADAQAKMRRDQELGMAKIRAELESARRAEARGDFEAAFKHKQDADKIARDLEQTEFSNKMDMAKLREQARGNTIQASTAARLPQLVQVAEDIQRKNPQMSPNEAMERAASYLASGQYQTAAQREKAAMAKDLAGRTNFLDMQMATMDPNSSEYKKMETQRQKIVERFMAEQKMLGGKLDGNAPAMPIKGTVERVG